MSSEKHCKTFPLRIPASTRAAAAEMARRSGVSLNYFILVAIADRISRLEASRTFETGQGSLRDPASGQVVAIDERF